MWNAKITGKEIVNGTLKVVVEFSEGNDTTKFSEVFETNQRQNPTWLQDAVQRKLEALNYLPILHAGTNVGDEITLLPAASSSMSAAKSEYKAKLEQFLKFTTAVSFTLTTAENKDFAALRNWLATNFKSEYIDLF